MLTKPNTRKVDFLNRSATTSDLVCGNRDYPTILQTLSTFLFFIEQQYTEIDYPKDQREWWGLTYGLSKYLPPL